MPWSVELLNSQAWTPRLAIRGYSCMIGKSCLASSPAGKVRMKATLVAVLVVALLDVQPQQDKVDRAKTDLRNLQQAAEVFKLRAGFYPETLKKLTEMHQNPTITPLLHEKLLIDPWGQPYKYDPKMLNQMTGSPLIWSEGPDPKDAKGKITNWDLQPPVTKKKAPVAQR
jgi:Type II secretion system (T2SS), protein G